MTITTPLVATETTTTTNVREDVDTWNELVSAIQAHDGIALVPMEILRKLDGAQRLGVHVLKSISARLATLGVGHMPETLPNRQDQEAILYRYGTPASDVISAVRNGLTTSTDVKSTYRALHKLNSAPESTEVVHREVLDDGLRTAARAVLELLGPKNVDDLLSEGK